MEVRGGQIKASYVASGDLSAAQFRLMNFTGTDVYLPVASGSAVLGVLQNHPNNNQEATLVTLGHTRVVVAGSLAAGAVFMTNNTGYATLASSGQWCAGFLVTGADSGLVAEGVVSPFRSPA